MIIFSLLGLVIILIILVDAFETIILPRPVTRRLRLSRIFFRTLWKLWKKGKILFPSGNRAKDYLGVYGPLSLIILISVWAICLIFGFALVNFGLQTVLNNNREAKDFITYLLVSGATFFPVSIDTYPILMLGKFMAIIESGVGFAFLAMVIGYLPVLYQGFSRREVNINLLDSHAGSPPNAMYLLQQLSRSNHVDDLKAQLANWEVWCAELLETNVSYTVLAYYRSQHDNQSWVAALIMILDAATLILLSEDHELHTSAKATFAIARHAAVDLSQTFYLTPIAPSHDRLSEKDLATLRKLLQDSGFILMKGAKADAKLLHLRQLYEPYVQALSNYFLMSITPFIADGKVEEAWRRNI